MILALAFFLLNFANSAPLELPEEGAYVGAYVVAGPWSDEVSVENIKNFEELINKKLSWVYFSNNWLDGQINFPKENVLKAMSANVIPYIRLMPWSEYTDGSADPIFTMDVLLSDRFNEDLRAWAREAALLDTHYIIEFGPEVNGSWFPWNGKWNGANQMSYGDPSLPDGPERFRDVFRKIISLFREEGLHNVTWVWHVDTAWSPHARWNDASNYYPGDEYIDWIGLSVFGAQLPNHEWLDFFRKFRNFYPQIERIAEKKPIIISEFAVIEDPNIPSRKADWISRALGLVESGRYPIKAITYWNSEGWLPDAAADFRITSSVQATEAFIERLREPFWKVSPLVERNTNE